MNGNGGGGCVDVDDGGCCMCGGDGDDVDGNVDGDDGGDGACGGDGDDVGVDFCDGVGDVAMLMVLVLVMRGCWRWPCCRR